jgi:tetratricopeptide (TPR) repeat protein
LALGLAACAGPYAERREASVERRYGDRIVEGAYVSPSAYEHYIRAMLQQNAGRPDDAVDSLRRALGSDGASGYLRVRLADALLAVGRLDEARDELDAASRLEPDRPEAFVVRSRLFSRLGDRAGAEAALEHAIALDPGLEEAYLALAALQRDAGREALAIRTLGALAAHVASAPAEEALGRAALRARNRKGAREHLRRAIELDGARNDARVELARLALGDGDVELGLASLTTAAERSREPRLSLELARAFVLSGRRAQGLALLDRLEEDAATPGARLDVAVAFLDVGVPNRAASIATAVLAEDRRGDHRGAARAVSARAVEALGKPRDAIAIWQEVLATDPEYVIAVSARARLLREAGRASEARAALEAAITDRVARLRFDERDQLEVVLAELRAGLGERDEALAALEALSTSRPRASALRLARARLERAAGRGPRALALLEPLAQGGDLRAAQALAELLADAHHLAEAQRVLERAEGAAPHDVEIADVLGTVYLQLGRLDDAERLLLRADRLAPPDVDVLVHLARLYDKKDDHDRARATLRRALATRPAEHVRQEIEAQLIMLERGRMGAR